MLRQAAHGQEITLGPTHAKTFHSIHWLGRSLYCQGEYKAAERKFRTAYKRQQQTLDHANAATRNFLSCMNDAKAMGRRKY
jgi:TolA-binding protein